MKLRDSIVIPLAAIAVMVLNVVISFGVVWIYSSFINPGETAAFYQDVANSIAPVSSVIAGIPLMFLAGYLLARGRPGRAGLLAGAALASLYILLDTTILLSVGAGYEVWMWAAVSHATKLLSALLGAKLGGGQGTAEVTRFQ